VRLNEGRHRTDHPLGCHRSRIPERVVFEKLVQVLVFGGACERGEQDPAQETGRLSRLLDEIEAKRARFQHLYAEGVIEMEDLRARLSPEDRDGLFRRLNLAVGVARDGEPKLSADLDLTFGRPAESSLRSSARSLA
jgi:hypothetical protein